MGNDLKESKINLPLLLAIKNFLLERKCFTSSKRKKKEDIYYVNKLVKKKWYCRYKN